MSTGVMFPYRQLGEGTEWGWGVHSTEEAEVSHLTLRLHCPVEEGAVFTLGSTGPPSCWPAAGHNTRESPLLP